MIKGRRYGTTRTMRTPGGHRREVGAKGWHQAQIQCDEQDCHEALCVVSVDRDEQHRIPHDDLAPLMLTPEEVVQGFCKAGPVKGRQYPEDWYEAKLFSADNGSGRIAVQYKGSAIAGDYTGPREIQLSNLAERKGTSTATRLSGRIQRPPT